MVTIRRATINDAARIAETHVRSWQSAYRGLFPQDYLDSLDRAQRLAMRQQILASVNWAVGGVLVAEGESGLTGFTDFGPTRDADEDPSLIGEIRALRADGSVKEYDGPGFTLPEVRFRRLLP